jgi:ComF family protein
MPKSEISRGRGRRASRPSDRDPRRHWSPQEPRPPRHGDRRAAEREPLGSPERALQRRAPGRWGATWRALGASLSSSCGALSASLSTSLSSWLISFPALTSLAERSLSWIFRPQCAACGEPVASGLPFCAECAPTLAENLVCCPRCAEPLEAARSTTCERCRTRPLPLHKIVAPWQYGGALSRAIVRLKFCGRPEVARALAPLIAPVLVASAIASDAAMIVPVPLHWTRRLHRGFDQTQLLLRHATALAPCPVPVVPALRRVRATEYQSRTDSARGRLRNVSGALRLEPGCQERVAGKIVVVFDDVVTTGATLAAAARALRRAGAARVIGVALARGG